MAIGCSRTRQRPAPARYVARGRESTGHRTEIAGTTRECRIETLEMGEKVPRDLFRVRTLSRQRKTKDAEATSTGLAGRASESQEVHHLPEDGMPLPSSL